MTVDDASHTLNVLGESFGAAMEVVVRCLDGTRGEGAMRGPAMRLSTRLGPVSGCESTKTLKTDAL